MKNYNKNDIELEVCKRSDPRYKEIRDRHYIPNNGTHGQQIHFLIWYKNEIVGIISGASSVYSVKERDLFFNIPNDRYKKEKFYLPAIINNSVFRLEFHEKNLATKVLSKFRKVVSELWEYIYEIPVIGFETFVIENDTRKGALYKADNWIYIGNTFGSTKHHSGLKNKSDRIDVCKKMIFCRWKKNPVIPKKEYISSWKMETEEEKNRAKNIKNKKEKLIGQKF